MTVPAREFRCPLCGGDNGCAPASSGSFETPCWCTTAEFPPELLEQLAAADRRRSCLCARCARAALASATSAIPRPTSNDDDEET